MVRSTHFLRIIEKEHLVENAGKGGRIFSGSTARSASRKIRLISAARGRGLFLAFDLPDAKTREEFWKGFFDLGVLTLRSGENSIRFRPPLDITAEVIDEAMDANAEILPATEMRSNETTAFAVAESLTAEEPQPAADYNNLSRCNLFSKSLVLLT